MLEIYSGNVLLNTNREAQVDLPAWFEALNGDFRYQLTPIGAPGPNLYSASEIAGGHFTIAGGKLAVAAGWFNIHTESAIYFHANNSWQNLASDPSGQFVYVVDYGTNDLFSFTDKKWLRTLV